MARRLRRIATLCLAFLVAGGCGEKAKPDAVVRGQVLYRGEALAGGLIVFTPNLERGSDGPVLVATLQDDGSFTLAGADGKPVSPGWYRIAVAPRAGTVDVPTPERPYPGLPAKYRNPALSGLEHEIKPGAETVISFDLDDS
jgi:hypothetical protein